MLYKPTLKKQQKLTMGNITALKIASDITASAPCGYISLRNMGHVTEASR